MLSFRLARRNVITKRNENWVWSQVSERSSFFPQSHAQWASTVTQKKSKRLLAVSEAINYTRNMISSLKVIFNSYFIDGQVFFRIFTFYVVFEDLSLNWLERVCKKTKIKETWWAWRAILIIAENKPHAYHKTHLHTMSLTIEVCSLRFLFFWTTEVITCSKVINAFKR